MPAVCQTWWKTWGARAKMTEFMHERDKDPRPEDRQKGVKRTDNCNFH